MLKSLLEMFDIFINKFLIKHVDIMPMRFVKMIAYFYSDARVRKIYLKRMGLTMGDGTFGNFGLKILPNDDYSESVLIGKNVSIATNVTFIPNSEPNNSELLQNIPYVRNKLIKRNAKIVVEDNVWLGANSVIMPGITIREGSIIGAGAVVVKDTEPYAIYAGVPARKIRTLNIED